MIETIAVKTARLQARNRIDLNNDVIQLLKSLIYPPGNGVVWTAISNSGKPALKRLQKRFKSQLC